VLDLKIEEQGGFGLAMVMARKGVDAGAIARALGMPAPELPRWQARDGLTLLGVGPGVWLAHAETAPADLAQTLQSALGPLASVSDQSSGYLIQRLSGPGARTLLQRGAAIDFHPSAFGPGSVATTVIAHIGAIVWQVDDAPSYHVAFFRSFAGSFRHWLDAAAAIPDTPIRARFP